jgi:hypothetical protein
LRDARNLFVPLSKDRPSTFAIRSMGWAGGLLSPDDTGAKALDRLLDSGIK